MIKLLTDCAKCAHNKVCRYKDNAKNDMEKLSRMTYGEGLNDDYDWDVMSNSRNVTIGFSCDMFSPNKDVNFR